MLNVSYRHVYRAIIGPFKRLLSAKKSPLSALLQGPALKEGPDRPLLMAPIGITKNSDRPFDKAPIGSFSGPRYAICVEGPYRHFRGPLSAFFKGPYGPFKRPLPASLERT